MLLRLKIFFIFLFVLSNVWGQNRMADSLKSILEGNISDSLRADVLIDLSWSVRLADPDSAISITNQVISMLPVIKGKQQWKEITLGRCYHQLGEFYWRKSELPEALNYSFKSLAIWEKLLRDPPADIRNALKNRYATTLGNVSNIYNSNRNYDKALEYGFAALKIDRELNNREGVSRHTGNIGLIYFYKGDFQKSLEFLEESRALATEINNKILLASVYCNVGNVYYETKQYDKALENYSKAIELNREAGDKISVAINLGNKGILLLKQDKYALAKEQLNESLEISREIGDKEGCREMEFYLALADSVTGHYRSSLEHYKRYIYYRDSISNEENVKKQTQLEMQYAFDKKDAEAKAVQLKKDAILKEEKRKQEIILWSVISGLILVVAFAVFIYRSFKEKQKANIEISRQKDIIEQKQKEVLDSIQYAKRIQQSLLPNEKYIERVLKSLK